MLNRILILTLLISSLFVFAQTDNDPIYVNYNYFPRRDMKEANGSAVYHQIEANLFLPGIKLGKSTKIYTNLNYKSNFYNFEDTNSNIYTKHLDDFRLGFIVMTDFAENWQAISAQWIRNGKPSVENILNHMASSVCHASVSTRQWIKP